MLNRFAILAYLWFNTPSATAHTKGETMDTIEVTYKTEGQMITATLKVNGHSFTGVAGYDRLQAVKNAMRCFLI